MIKGKWIASFQVHPYNPDILYVSRSDGIFLVSDDAGFSWHHKQDGLPELPALCIEVSRLRPHILYAGFGYMIPQMGDGLYKSEDGGMSWKRMTTGLEANPLIRSIAIDPTNDSIVYVADFFSGVYYTENGGEEWQKIDSGLTHSEVLKLELSSDGSVLYAGTEGGGVFRLGELPGDPTHVSINKSGNQSITVENSFPNPFSTVSTLHFAVIHRCKVGISVYTATGQLVRTLAEQVFDPGSYSVQWDGTRVDGSAAENGMYLIRIQSGNQTKTVKIAFMR